MATYQFFINGMGVIGRQLFRMIIDAGTFNNNILEVVGINDPYNNKIENIVYLLKYDTVYGQNTHQFNIIDANSFSVDGKVVDVTFVSSPGDLEISRYGSNVVAFDCLGRTYGRASNTIDEWLNLYLLSGAWVAITCSNTKEAPSLTVPTIGYGLNSSTELDDSHSTFISVLGDTIAVATLLKILDEGFGVEYGIPTNITSYSNLNNLQDSLIPLTEYQNNPQVGRAGAWNIIPLIHGYTSWWASVGCILPDLSGKFSASEKRVPTITGACIDINAVLSKAYDSSVVKDIVNGYLKESDTLYDKVTKELPIVSWSDGKYNGYRNILCSSDMVNKGYVEINENINSTYNNPVNLALVSGFYDFVTLSAQNAFLCGLKLLWLYY